MNTTRTLLCCVLLLTAGGLVSASAAVVEDFRVSWARADGDKLIMGGGMKEGKHGAVCMVDADGTITRLCEGDLSSSYDDVVLDAATIFAVGMDFADFRIEAWRNKERLYAKTLEFDYCSVGEARIFAMEDHVLLICELGENPKMPLEPRLLVAKLSKEDGSIISSETVTEYDKLLWAGRDESGDVCFIAANTADSSETMYLVSLALYRVGEKVVREKQFAHHQKLAEGEYPADLQRMERVENRFVAFAWSDWNYQGVNYLISADPESGFLTTSTFQSDPESLPQRWFLGDNCFYVWFHTFGETSEGRVAEVSLKGHVAAMTDPRVAARKALTAEGWVADENENKFTKPGTDLVCYVFPESLEVVQFGDTPLLLYSLRQDDTKTRDMSLWTLLLKEWK